MTFCHKIYLGIYYLHTKNYHKHIKVPSCITRLLSFTVLAGKVSGR